MSDPERIAASATLRAAGIMCDLFDIDPEDDPWFSNLCAGYLQSQGFDAFVAKRIKACYEKEGESDE